jgi:hypothetical protein
MTIDAAGTPAPPAAATPSKNSFARIAGVLFSPGETFADIARKPDIIVPLLVMIIIGYVTTALTAPRMDFSAITAQQAEQMRKQNPNMSDADIERMERITASFTKVTVWISPILAVVWYLIIALLLWGGVRLMGGEGTFKQAFSATVYSWFPMVLFGIIVTIVILARGTFDPTQMATIVKSNPAFLVDMKEQPILFSLLGNFDVFTIWTVVLLIFGFAAVSKLPKGKVAAIVLVLWAVFILLRLGGAAIGAAGMKA